MLRRVSTSNVDMDAYFERIGYTGPRTASLETLRSLHALHPAHIPFENLSPFAGAPVPLDLPAIEQKLVREQRGGYCFEHNLLFLKVLTTLGFKAWGLQARVLWNRPDDAITARGHMLLHVEADGQWYLADVGFGGQTLTTPLRLETGVAQPTPHEPFRLVAASDGDFLMQSQGQETWRTLYRFDLVRAFPVDYEVSNYFLSTHPSSHFRLGLFVARTIAGQRLALGDRRLSVHRLGGTSEQRTLQSPLEIRDTLEHTFGIRVPETPQLQQAFEGLFNKAQ